MSNILDENICKNISEIIYDITNKNYKIINDKVLNKLVDACGDSDVYVERVYCLLMDYLKKPHAEIRYNAFYILDTFFKKYECFRQLVVEDLKSTLDLTTNINCSSYLPPPKNVANELNRLALKSVKEWVQMFKSSYAKLHLCYEFLSRKKNVNFEKLEIEDHASFVRRQKEQEKKQKITAKKLTSLKKEIDDLEPEIKNLMKSLESCLEMLVPPPEQFFINDLIEKKNTDKRLRYNTTSSVPVDKVDECLNSEVDENAAVFRENGMLKGNFSININLPKSQIKIRETDENSVIIENAKDYYKLFKKKYLDVVKNWIKNLTILSEDPGELKQIIEMKMNIDKLLKKYESLTFENVELPSEKDDNIDSDTDLEEVIQHFPSADEEIIANLTAITSGNSTGIGASSFNNKDCIGNNTEIKQIDERKRKLLEIAPKLPFDVDLYHCQDENLHRPVLLPITAEGRNFWSATSLEDIKGLPIPEGTASLRTRIIEFTGKFEPVKWRCRFPLSNGKLCPRQDRYKCPFHGTIVARNESGQCVNPENAKKDEELKRKLNYSEAQNPRLLAEIRSVTGIDLKLPERKRRKKTDECGLTNIKNEQNTVYRRLEKKLFRRSTAKKVSVV